MVALCGVLVVGGRLLALELAPRIVVDPSVRAGRPVVRGTRVPVELVLGKLAGGMAAEEVAAEYDLDLGDVQAVLAFHSTAESR